MKSEQMSYTDWYHGMAEIKKKMILFLLLSFGIFQRQKDLNSNNNPTIFCSGSWADYVLLSNYFLFNKIMTISVICQ